MRKIFTFLMMAFALYGEAQNTNHERRNIEYLEYQVNKNYSDSLVAYKERLDSLQEALEALGRALAEGYTLKYITEQLDSIVPFLEEGDELIAVREVSDTDFVVLATSQESLETCTKKCNG